MFLCKFSRYLNLFKNFGLDLPKLVGSDLCSNNTKTLVENINKINEGKIKYFNNIDNKTNYEKNSLTLEDFFNSIN